MEIQRLVTGAKLGNDQDFGTLVKLYQRRLHGSVVAILGSQALAEEVVQEAFLKAWTSLSSLKKAEAFPGWLWSIARNLARTLCRRRKQGEGECDEQPDWESFADPRPQSLPAEGEEVRGLAEAMAVLSVQQRELVGLRHEAGLSLRQIASVLAIPEPRVKSRLHSVRKKLEEAMALPLPRTPSSFLEEKIMDKIQTLRLGAHVFERLSLAAQVELALSVLSQQSLSEVVLNELGRIDRGTEFLSLYGTKLALEELIGVLTHVDRFTECRLIERLEVLDPDRAEVIKQNFFVFEDILCFDTSALRLLNTSVDPNLLVLALAGTELRVRQHFLSALPPEESQSASAQIAKANTDRRLVRAAQELVVNAIKDLEQTGKLLFQRPSESETGMITATAV